jgi:anti-anti-sigma factor
VRVYRARNHFFDHGLTVSLVGELDLATAPRTRQLLGRILELGQGTMAADLSRLKFIDAAGMRVLLEAYRMARKQKRAPLLVGAAPRTQGLLKILQLGEMIEGFSERPEAMIGFAAGALSVRAGDGASVEQPAPFMADGLRWTRTA